MKIHAPITIELSGLNDWTYFKGLRVCNIDWIMVRAGWPPLLLLKVCGLGFRLEVYGS